MNMKEIKFSDEKGLNELKESRHYASQYFKKKKDSGITKKISGYSKKIVVSSEKQPIKPGIKSLQGVKQP